MIDIKFKGIEFHYDDTSEEFTVITEKQERRTFTNAAEAREIFISEIERLFRRFINRMLEKLGFNIHTGVKNG